MKQKQNKKGSSTLTAILILIGMIAIVVLVVLAAPKEQAGGIFWFAIIAAFFGVLLIISIVNGELQKRMVREMKAPPPSGTLREPEHPREEKSTQPPHPFEYRILDHNTPLHLSPEAGSMLEWAESHLGQAKINLRSAAVFIWAWYFVIGLTLILAPKVLPNALTILCGFPLALIAAGIFIDPKKSTPETSILVWGGLRVIGTGIIVIALLSAIYQLLVNRAPLFGLIVIIALCAAALGSAFLFDIYLGSKINRDAKKGKRLLILWVFGKQENLLRILGGLGMYWRYIGSVQFLQGGDYTLDANQVVSYMFGKRSLLVRTQEQLRERLNSFKETPNRSGVYPMHSMLCGDVVWKQAIDHFLNQADFVAMNLSGFSPANQGCLYELGLLTDRFPSDKILFLADDSTDMDFLLSTLNQTWDTMPASSPNHTSSAAPLRIYKIRPANPDDQKQMLKLFFEIAAGP